MHQSITIVGNLGGDPELRFTPSGVPVANFNVATNRKWTDATTNEKHEEVTWFRVSCWRKQAETVAEYLKKGQSVLVTGEVKARAYTASDGTPAATLEVQAQTVRFLSSKSNGGDVAQTGGTQTEPPLTDEAIPF